MAGTVPFKFNGRGCRLSPENVSWSKSRGISMHSVIA
jgi:hypothetical protein